MGTDDLNHRGESTDGSALQAWVRALQRSASVAAEPYVTLPVLMQNLASRFELSPALVGESSSLSYRALSDRANRYARWALDQGLRAGEVVCLLMLNSPEYMAAWLGITQIGGVVALLNTQLSGEVLAHSINVAGSRHVIVAGELAAAFETARPRIAGAPQCWLTGTLATAGFLPIDEWLHRVEANAPPTDAYQAPSLKDRALLIYTSGTTGLPKAAHVSHFRVMQWCHWFAGLMDTGPQDRMYNCLPMYHSIGGVVATGATLVGGGTVIVRQRFSARDFWADVTATGCTLFQYIGELCRYLVNNPVQPLETQHQLRICCGNGLRPDVWSEFQKRFRIPRILEYYAATEGNFSLYNCEGKVGAIGRIPAFLAHRLPVALVKSDFDTGEPVRDGRGLCIRCQPDEVGEAIGKIQAAASAASQFEGYTDEAASKRKILRDVFAPGDQWYRTGDLMRKDAQGYFYFVDRIGDTYRWKGENVSTVQVAEAVASCEGVLEAVIYGVTVHATEGRAGMAALLVDERFELAAFRCHITQHLPDYARPVFVRILARLEATGTFKPKKQDLVRAGYDPALVRDRLYLNDKTAARFVELDSALYERIQSGSLRL